MKSVATSTIQLALLQSSGNVAHAARLLGVTRGELLMAIACRPPLRTLLEDFRQEMLDNAEAVLRAAVADKERWAIEFTLKTLGQPHGFGPAPEQPLIPSLPPQAEDPGPVDFSLLTPEQCARFEVLYTRVTSPPDEPPPPEPEFVQCLDRTQLPATLADGRQHHEEAGAAVHAVLTSLKGHLSLAASQLGVSRAELADYITRRPHLQQVIIDAREELVDNAESALKAAILDRKSWAVRFALKYLAQPRGYDQRLGPPPYPFDLPKPGSPQPNWDRLNPAEIHEFGKLVDILCGRPNARFYDALEAARVRGSVDLVDPLGEPAA